MSDCNNFGGALDFTELMDSVLEDFLARPVVEAEIEDFITQNKSGCCVITGEPGSGKTALAASLIRRHNYIHHFLRRGHTEFGIWRDPYVFLTSVAFQLRERFGDSLFPAFVEIDVKGCVRSVSENGEAVGAEIERIIPLPWSNPRIRVDLKAKDIRGTTVGIRIKELADDYRHIQLNTFREIALIEPLKRLSTKAPEKQVVLWVDGLDEESDTVSETGGANNTNRISDLLLGADEANQLGNLIVIVTSRRGEYLDRLLSSDVKHINLNDTRFAKELSKVAQCIIERELQDPEVVKPIEKSGYSIKKIRELLAKQDINNFLCLRHFFVAIRCSNLQVLLKNGLPPTLDSIYARLMGKLARSAGKSYLSELHPVVKVLAVARATLSGKQLVNLTGLQRNHINSSIKQLEQFLDIRSQKTTKVYTLYHPSLSDSLTNVKHTDEVWYVDPCEANGMIARYYHALNQEDWVDMDGYGFSFFTDHLVQSGKEEQRNLIELIGEQWRKVRRDHDRSNWAFGEDLIKAYNCISALSSKKVIPTTVQLALMDIRFRKANEALPKRALESMTKIGQYARAFEYLQPELEMSDGIERAADIVRGLSTGGEFGQTLMFKALNIGLRFVEKKPDHIDLATLLEACPASNNDKMQRLVDKSVELFDKAQPYWATPCVLAEIGRLLTALDAKRASEFFHWTLDAINRFTKSSRTLELQRLFRYWSNLDLPKAAELIGQLNWIPDHNSVETILSVRQAQAVENPMYLKKAIDFVTNQFIPGIKDPYDLAIALSCLAYALFMAGDASEAGKKIKESMEVVATIATNKDPSRTLQNRGAQAAEVWVHLADVSTRIGSTEGQTALKRAWQETYNYGLFNEVQAIQKLVRTQLQSNEELLLPQIERIADTDLQASFLIVASLELSDKNERLAADLLEKSLSLAETRIDTGGDTTEFAVAMAKAMGTERREEAKNLLADLGCCNEGLVSWYIAFLDELIEQNSSTVENWLWDAIGIWSSELNNYTIAFPTFLGRKLPKSLALSLAKRINEIESAPHRLLLSGTLSAKLRDASPDISNNLKNKALELLRKTNLDQSHLRYSEVLAYFAGQWWNIDRSFAEKLWEEALLWAKSASSNARDRSLLFTWTVKSLMHGAPDAALTALLSYEELPGEPGVITLIMPGVNTPPTIAAGVSETDYLTSLALAAAAKDPGSPARKWIPNLTKSHIVSMAAAFVARQAEDLSLADRVEWCDKAAEHSRCINEHHIRCLLTSEVADAYLSIGLPKQAKKLAVTVAIDIIENGEAYESIFREPGYAHALGKLIKILALETDIEDLASWVWQARVLGKGMMLMLAYIPQIVAKQNHEALDLLLSAYKSAEKLFA
ncbi:MAG: hypothetical protein ACFFCW_09315 [Candidatus Hodarchaeota archaeon]